MVNYLALLGWGYDDSQTIFSIPELIEKFSLERVSKNPAVFDKQKLEWMNGVYIRELTLEGLYEVCLPFCQKAGLLPEEVSPELKDYTLRVLEQLQSRLKLVADVVDLARYFYRDDYEYNMEVVQKILTKPQTEEILGYVHAAVKDAPSSMKNISPQFQEGLKKFGIRWAI